MPKVGRLFLAAALLFACIPIALALNASLRARPHGSWDAFAIWNVRAKHLAGPDWRTITQPEFDPVVADYPLLVPAAAAVAGPVPVAVLFLAATTALVVAAVAILHSPAMGLLAGLVFLTGRTWLWEAASLCADVPLSFFILATVVMMLLDRPLAAGLAASLGSWTKNEGLVFFALTVVLCAVFLRRRMRTYLLGALPVVVLVGIYKLFIAGRGYLADQPAGQALAQLADPARYLAIAKQFGIVVLGFGQGIVHPIVLLAILAAAYGVRRGALARPEVRFSAAAIALLVASYCAVYLVTPLDLEWQLATSLARLVCHVWPAALVVACLSLGRASDTMSS